MTTERPAIMNSRELAKASIRRGAFQKVSELSALIGRIHKRVIRTVVEIGTARGGTLYLWAQLAQPDALLISVDLPGGPFSGGYTAAARRINECKRPDQTMRFVMKDSHEPSTRDEVRDMLGGQKVDLLMLDGDHTYEGVSADWALYSPFVKRNGLIVFHDIITHTKTPSCQVDRFWHQVKLDFRHIELCDHDDDRGWGPWGGIGVIYFGMPPRPSRATRRPVNDAGSGTCGGGRREPR